VNPNLPEKESYLCAINPEKMENIVEQNISGVFELCRSHHVKNMYVFGSVLTDRFSSGSDVDLLISFEQVAPSQYFDNYMELKEKLEHLLSRPVDLLEEQAVRNPVLRRSIDRNKKLVYGRAS
jgi:predicted nucleotidyltransferase